MARWCTRDVNEVVTETVDIDPTGRYHPSFVWYSCPDTVEQGMVWTGTEYITDPWHFSSDEEVANARYLDNAVYAASLEDAAEANPEQGVILAPHQTKKENKRRNNRAKGKNKLSNADDVLSTYVDDVLDTLDTADDAVESNTRQQNIDWNPANMTWPLWTAPVGADESTGYALAEAHAEVPHTMVGVDTTPESLAGYDISAIGVGVSAQVVGHTASFTAQSPGLYRMSFWVELSSDQNGVVRLIPNIDGAPTLYRAAIDLSNPSTDVGSVGMNVLISLLAGQTVAMYVNTDGNAMDLLIDSLVLTIEKE